MGIFGFDSVSDIFDGGGRGGSGSEFSTLDHSDYVRDFEARRGFADPNAMAHDSVELRNRVTLSDGTVLTTAYDGRIEILADSHVPDRVIDAVEEAAVAFYSGIQDGSIKSQNNFRSVDIRISDLPEPVDSSLDRRGTHDPRTGRRWAYPKRPTISRR